MFWSTLIEEEAESRLKKREWRFCIFDGLKVFLDWIIDYERPSLRHKYHRVKGWERFSNRNSDMKRIDPPDSIKAIVKQRVQDELSFS